MSARQVSLLVPGALILLALPACSRATPAGPPTRDVPAAERPRDRAPVRSSPARARMRPRNGLEVIGAMRRAHPSRQLKSIAFTLVPADSANRKGADGRTRAVAKLPGRFRMTELPATRRTGSVRNQQRLALFQQGRRVASRERVDLATLLAYDVFAQGIDTTIRWLDAARVRYGMARRDRLDGRDVWVVGAEAGDMTSPQFWVDEDTWRVVRVIQRDPSAPTRSIDVRFPAHSTVLDLPLPSRVDVYRNGQLVERHAITNIVVNPVLPASAFDVSRWHDVRVGS